MNQHYDFSILQQAFGVPSEPPEPCEECEGCGWVQVYSPCPPAFGVCQACFNPDDNPSP